MNLKELRKNAQLRQRDAAAALGVTQSAVSQWESGRCGLRVDLLTKMALLYRCSAQELLSAAQKRVYSRNKGRGIGGTEAKRLGDGSKTARGRKQNGRDRNETKRIG